MRYPDKFVTAVKAAYPGWESLHRMLDEGSEMVGRVLDDSRVRFTPDDIIKATSLEALQAEAKKANVREFLYARWCRLYREHYAAQPAGGRGQA